MIFIFGCMVSIATSSLMYLIFTFAIDHIIEKIDERINKEN